MSEWHKKSVQGLARVVCDHCGILEKWGSMSEWHKKSVHGMPRVVCDRCGKLLDGIYRMGRHRRIHKEASCVDCQDLEDPFPLPCSRAGIRLPPVRALPHTRPALLLQVPHVELQAYLAALICPARICSTYLTVHIISMTDSRTEEEGNDGYLNKNVMTMKN